MLSPSQQFQRRTVSAQCHRHSMSRRSAFAHRCADPGLGRSGIGCASEPSDPILRHMGVRVWLALVGVVALASICASGAQPGAPDASASARSHSGQIDYPDVGISTTPAPRGTPTAVSRRDAIRRIATGEYAPVGRAVPSVELAWIRSNAWPDKLPTKARLGWVLTYRDVLEPPQSVPGTRAGTSPVPLPWVSCVFTAMVDAQSGQDRLTSSTAASSGGGIEPVPSAFLGGRTGVDAAFAAYALG